MNYANDAFVQDNITKTNEGLIITHDINSAKNIICRKFNLRPQQFCITPISFDNTIVNLGVIILEKGTSQSVIGEIKHYMQTLGYFECVKPKYVEEKIVLIFEPYYQLPITQEILNDDIVNWKQWIWIEASGKVEEMCKTLGAFNVPSDYAIIYLQNVPYEGCDEYHYSRMIAGKKEIKTIFGFKDAETFEIITNDLNNKVEEFLKKTQNKKGGLNENLLKKEEIYQRYIQKKGDCQRYKDIIDYFIYLHEDEGINELPIESLNILHSAVDSLQEIIDTSNELIINRKYLKMAIEEGNELLTRISALYPITVLVLTPI
jgi:hypothetical protein